ncbi:lactonase family protein [Cellvibrio polysaccharolyticus]|uniref:Lactonase family protein n=1 Tax=Cellvibrio polysaccharolyticus TaxID=2082724 RepID=A0A928YVJ5_9GAMM|nr:beta-propeller fold lactonase family protein [Cellvibrio polysaccharolyticus]MBE8718620.1 lactonase family protein [Cellvibrio polysaccharolyticus]
MIDVSCKLKLFRPGAKRYARLFSGAGVYAAVLFLLLLNPAAFAKTIIYIANADSQDIAVFQLNNDTDEPLLLQRYAVKGTVMPMALSPDNRRLYVAIRSEPYRLLVLDIDPANGRLSPKAVTPLVDSMANISVDSSGRYLFAASYGGNKISVHSLNDAGIPEVPPRIFATGKHPHQITADSRNRFVYLSVLGEDRLDFFRFSSLVSGKAQATETRLAATFPQGAGPRHFVASADEKYWYVIGELDARIHVLKRNPISGKSSHLENHALLGAGSATKPWAADIHLTPDGNFLYASERTSGEMSGFRLNKKSGRITPIGKWKTETQPRAFQISPDGRHLVVVGQKSDHASIYSINAETGELEAVQRIAAGQNPSWIEIIRLHDID